MGFFDFLKRKKKVVEQPKEKPRSQYPDFYKMRSNYGGGIYGTKNDNNLSYQSNSADDILNPLNPISPLSPLNPFGLWGNSEDANNNTQQTGSDYSPSSHNDTPSYDYGSNYDHNTSNWNSGSSDYGSSSSDYSSSSDSSSYSSNSSSSSGSDW